MTADRLVRSIRGAERTSRLRSGRLWAGIVLLLAAGAAVTPYAMVALGTRRAGECLARFADARGPARPDCGLEMVWFVPPSRLPATAARYRAEELTCRIAIEGYRDAAVGAPDRAELDRRADDLRLAQELIRKGSQRLELDELGPAVGAPSLGRSADALGDRKTLLARRDEWTDWHVRAHALEAALLEGDVPLAGKIAKGYAEWDPRDEDLRSTVAAVLCLAGDAKRGLELYTLVQDERAARKHANFSRNWGEVRAGILACSAKLGVPPPDKPNSEAGRADADEARAVMRVRLAHATPDDEREAQLAAVAMLKAAPRSPAGRRALLASVLASPHELDAAEAADLARARAAAGAAPLRPPPAITAADLLAEPRELRPAVSHETFALAAARLRRLAGDGGPDVPAGTAPAAPAKPGPPPAADVAAALRAAAGAMMIEVGTVLARAGEGDAAATAMGEGATLAGLGDAARALARSSARWVALDAAGALAELEQSSPPEGDAIEVRLVRAGFRLQRAELLASLGRRAEARDAALLAEEAARASGDPLLLGHARWTRVALAADVGPPPSAPAPPYADGEARPWPWIGSSELGAPWSRADGAGALDRALEGWRAALAAPPEVRRALRYAVLQRRGDAPLDAFAAYLTLGGELARGEADVEIWLDAFGVFDARRTSLRAYAWARAQAARWRGDADAAARWEARVRALAKAAADPKHGELAAILRL